MHHSYCRKEIYRVISCNEFAYAKSYCGKRDISTIFYHHLTEEFFDSADGRQMYITAPKSTITPASHGVVAGKYCVAIADTPKIKF